MIPHFTGTSGYAVTDTKTVHIKQQERNSSRSGSSSSTVLVTMVVMVAKSCL